LLDLVGSERGKKEKGKGERGKVSWRYKVQGGNMHKAGKPGFRLRE
jgi:hypothetical protein